MHCACCGPNCPLNKKNSSESSKHDSGCNQSCPLIATTHAVAVSHVKPLAGVMFAAVAVQRFLSPYSASFAIPSRHSAALDPPTLLSLSCALTI
jgi:hypothetical protein